MTKQKKRKNNLTSYDEPEQLKQQPQNRQPNRPVRR